MTEQTIASKKPVYTISLENTGWVRDNIEQPGNGRITLGAPEAVIDTNIGKNTLIVSLRRCAPGAFGDDYLHEVVEIQSAVIETADGEEYAPADLVDRIEIEGYRRVWSGAYVAIGDLQSDQMLWISAGEATSLYSLGEGTVRQAINRAIEREGKLPNWARKSGGTWLVKRAYAKAAWGNK